MLRLPEADKDFVKLLIIDCEDFHLNQKESLAYISKKMNRKISRTSYYNCKKDMSDNNSFTDFFLNSRWNKISMIIDNIALRNRILSLSTDTRIKCHNVWDDADFVSRYSDRFFADASDVITRTNRLSGRINSQKALEEKNSKSIPWHATIREEYTKCGKPECNRCNHGPYYYAYWKENGKTKKKYIGKYDPRSEANSENYELNF